MGAGFSVETIYPSLTVVALAITHTSTHTGSHKHKHTHMFYNQLT